MIGDINLRDLARAIDHIDAEFDPITCHGIGPHLTCGETNALSVLFAELGLPELATTLLHGHCWEDQEEEDDDPEHLQVKLMLERQHDEQTIELAQQIADQAAAKAATNA